MPPMASEPLRIEAGAALRDLIHTFAASDATDAQLEAVIAAAQAQTAALATSPRRDRLALIRAATGEGIPLVNGGAGYADRAVGGYANPTSLDMQLAYDGDEVVVRVVLRRAFEGAPGRAHGGIVAAAFDDVTGFVIGMLKVPSFTGELTVRYLAPFPVDEPVEIRARLESRERRKLNISAEARFGGDIVATCRAIYIAVDPQRFAGFPDPR
jgi:acyl-coenzyme A thioesterase PaaI-like protein